MMMNYIEQQMRETLGADLEISDTVEKRLNKTYQQIRSGEIRQKKSHKGIYAAAGTAAAVVAAGIFCVNNPAIASKLPVIGHIFERMQSPSGYGGDYSQIGEPLEEDSVAEQLENAESAEEMEQISAYTKTVDGLTVTLSEIYCNDQALYITMQLKSEEPLKETDGYACYTTEQYSFNPTEQMDVQEISGEYLDEYTYAGVLRLDLNAKTTDMSEYYAAREAALAAGEEWDDSWDAYDTNENWEKYVKTVEIPDSFTLDLDITELFGNLIDPDKPDYGKTTEEINAMSEEEWHDFITQWSNDHPDWGWHNEHEYASFEGDWNFTLNVTKNTEDTKIVAVNEVNEQGIGIEKVVKDRFEITVYDTYTGDAVRVDYIPVVLDADGRLMDDGDSGSVNTVAINDRDVSHLDIFLVDYMKWMDELKGDYLREENPHTADGRTAKEMLMEESAYHVEVDFEE
jgi:hypothetical protein